MSYSSDGCNISHYIYNVNTFITSFCSFPELRGCITCGDTIQETIENAEDAKRCWIEAAIEEGINIPEPKNSEDYSGQFKLRIPKALHKTLSEQSAQEGVSMNQYCVYLLTKGALG